MYAYGLLLCVFDILESKEAHHCVCHDYDKYDEYKSIVQKVHDLSHNKSFLASVIDEVFGMLLLELDNHRENDRQKLCAAKAICDIVDHRCMARVSAEDPYDLLLLLEVLNKTKSRVNQFYDDLREADKIYNDALLAKLKALGKL